MSKVGRRARPRVRPLVLALAMMLVLVAGCVRPPPEPADDATPDGNAALGALRIASGAFAEGANIPRKHTCDGTQTSPPLVISGAPANATTVALLMLDNDVPIPQAPQREVVHWIWWNAPLANGTLTVPEGSVANGTVQGAGAGGAKYAGPCPPQGSTAHRYVFTAHAVAGALNLKEGASKDELVAALADASLGSAKLTGLYARAILPT